MKKCFILMSVAAALVGCKSDDQGGVEDRSGTQTVSEMQPSKGSSTVTNSSTSGSTSERSSGAGSQDNTPR